jgi:glycosyltransferase involved in cell wall biosynthesis
LQSKGHTVDLLAAPGSKSYGGNLAIHHIPNRSKLSRIHRKIQFQLQSWQLARKADVVLCHARADYLWLLLKTSKPILVHFHHPLSQSDVDWLFHRRKTRLNIVGVSRDQVSHLTPVNRVKAVVNCSDVFNLKYQMIPDDPPYLAVLARLTPNKGIHLAIDAVQQVGMRLKIAGNISTEPGGQEYFDTMVKPRIGGNIEYIGPVDDQQKAVLLGGAKAFLFPTQWKEPCAVAPLEALACGCPVIGWKNGSVPEVLDDGKTGFIVETVEQMVTAIRQIDTISRAECRKQAEARFSPERYVDNYLELIDGVIAEPLP